VQTVRRVDLAPAELLKVHQHQLESIRESKTAIPALDDATTRDITEKHHAALRDFHLHRGVFIPRTDSDQAQAMRVEQLTHSGNPHAAVLIELEKSQRKRTSWGSAILILIVSLGLFIGIGASQWSWRFLWLLIPILAFHELGHYLAMKLFGYRNLRMFFIPMLGAAVSGQNYTAPAWKKVLVALAGPLPGIFVGILLGCVGWYYEKPLLHEAAVMTLLLNGLNLLPVLPLDGGRVVHTLLFSRHYVLDAAFRIVAAAILIAAGLYTNERILWMLGGLLLVSLPASFRMAKIASDLRREGIGPRDAADTFVPTDIATAIIDRLKDKLSKNTSNKVLAQNALSVYETIATKRAGIGATIGFAALHGFALLLTGAAVLVFMGAQQIGTKQNLQAMAYRAATAPKNSVSSTTITEIHKAHAVELPHFTVIATAPTATAAANMVEEFSSHADPTIAIQRFGHSAMIAIYDASDSARRNWVERIEARPEKPTLCVAGKATQISISMQCFARSNNDAKKIAEELQAYLGAPKAMALIPPWSPADTRTTALKTSHLIARQTLQKINAARYGRYDDPAFTAHNEKLKQALQRGDAETLADLRKESSALQTRLGLKGLHDLKDKPAAEIDSQVVDAYIVSTDNLKQPQLSDRDAVALGGLMGQLPLSGTQPSTIATRYSTRYGFATVEALIVTIHAAFIDPYSAAPELVKWLERKSCSHITYDFHGEEIRGGSDLDMYDD
jgi:Zn-dependent protease